MAIASYFRISIMPAGYLLGRGISPVDFHNTRLAFARLTTLGAGLLVAALLLCATEARVHSYVQDAAILADPSRIHSRLAVSFPFYHHRGFHHRIHPGGTGSRDLLMIISCPAD